MPKRSNSKPIIELPKKRARRVIPERSKKLIEPTVFNNVDVQLPSDLQENVQVLNCRTGLNQHFRFSKTELE